ncbi:MAG: type III restriction endonuclease subunit M, partial [Deltaproteobacteria bacterium CG07_land_8_20_14_0_80_38_7]
EKFKNNLNEKEINFSTESYGLDWLGKSYSRLLASDPATTLLKADETHNSKPENVNSENLLIKGDNLEVLKHLANAYYEQVKMIYIDPPYNTGSDGFTYQDDRKFSVKELQNLIGIDEEKSKRILDFTKQKSNSHSAWLTFMYPRLYIAKQLLKDDGVIFVSIDDNEVTQLRFLLDEVFGEENFIAQLPTIMNLKGNNDEFGFAGTHEYTIVYSKNKLKITLNQFNVSDDDLEDWTEDETGFYKQGANLKATGTNAPRAKRPNLYYQIFIDSNDKIYVTEDDNPPKEFTGELTTIYPITNGQEMSWRWSKDKVKNEPNNIIVSRNGNIGIYKKQRPALGDLPSKKPKTIFYKAEYSSGNGTAQIKSLLGDKYFANPKPIELLKDLILIGSSSDELVLDFFAGSGTTADALMQLNIENIEKRKFILVQLPEPIDPKKDKAAFDFVNNELKIDDPTIFEVTKERIIRAANKHSTTAKSKISEKIKEIKELETKLDLDGKDEKIKQLKAEIIALQKQDLGFKIFETTPIWEDYDFEAEQFDSSQTLFDVGKLTEEDIKALLITWKTYDGIALTQDLESIDLSGYTAYYGNNKLYLMNKGFITDHLKAMLEKIDIDKHFEPKSIIAFGYHFESKSLREISENVKTYNNKKRSDIDFITRY